MSRRDADVIVVGAGAVGAALALALARDGFDVAVVEARAPKPWQADTEIDPRVVALAADARELFADLDVWTAIAGARIGAYRRMRVWDAQAPGELAFDAAERGEAALGWIVESALIQHVLWRALAAIDPAAFDAASPVAAGVDARADAVHARRSARGTQMRTRVGETGRVRIHCPATVADVEQSDDGVDATFADGTHVRARLLVSAEGADSALRERLGIAFAGRDYAQRAVVAHVATERAHAHTAWQRFLPGGPLAFLPLADGRSSIVWTLPEPDAARVLALDDAAFRDELGCAFDFRLGAITATTARLSFPLRLRLAERYVAGRCVLAGDAAHVVHPLAGQGMNLGLRDVACLRRVFRDARARGSDIGAAHVLRRYERERRSENALAAYSLDGIERVFGSSHPLIAGVRGAVLAATDALQPVKDVFQRIAAGG